VESGEALSRVARELGLVEQTLRNWVKAAKNGRLNPPGGKAVTPEQMALCRVRAENARLKMEKDKHPWPPCDSGTKTILTCFTNSHMIFRALADTQLVDGTTAIIYNRIVWCI